MQKIQDKCSPTHIHQVPESFSATGTCHSGWHAGWPLPLRHPGHTLVPSHGRWRQWWRGSLQWWNHSEHHLSHSAPSHSGLKWCSSTGAPPHRLGSQSFWASKGANLSCSQSSRRENKERKINKGWEEGKGNIRKNEILNSFTKWSFPLIYAMRIVRFTKGEEIWVFLFDFREAAHHWEYLVEMQEKSFITFNEGCFQNYCFYFIYWIIWNAMCLEWKRKIAASRTKKILCYWLGPRINIS